MYSNQISQTSFNGGFKLKNLSPETRAEIPNIIKKGRQIFNDFGKEGDVFIVTRSEADKKVSKFISENKIDFEYYPSITTKSGLDDERPSELARLLASLEEPPITTMAKMKRFFKKVSRQNYIETKSSEYTNKILSALCINKNLPINMKKGAIVAVDKEFQRTIYISPPSKLNIHYVKVQPDSVNKSAERFAIDSEGNILTRFDSPDAMKIFNERFNRLLLK